MSVASARHPAQAPSSSGQRGLQAGGPISTRTARDKRAAADRASKLTVLHLMLRYTQALITQNENPPYALLRFGEASRSNSQTSWRSLFGNLLKA